MIPSLIKRTSSTIALSKSNLNKWHKFELEMWNVYKKAAPQAQKIQNLFEREGETLINDHVAFRTYNHKRISIDIFTQNLYKHYHYKPIDEYNIVEKHLTALHFEHKDYPTQYPLIFVSQFDITTLNNQNQQTIFEMIDTIDSNYKPVDDDKFLIRGKLWDPITIQKYDQLSLESQYASWVAAFGYIPNHFTVAVNYLHKYSTLKSVNKFLEKNGFDLNESGGKIKGNDNIGLMQSSTMASSIDVRFKDGIKSIPGCYYEFAQRFVIENDGELEFFRGFVGSQANKIFESTDIKE